MTDAQEFRDKIKSMPIKLESFSIRDGTNLDNDAGEGKRESRQELLRIVHRQQITVKIQGQGNGRTNVKGPLDLINWSEILLAKSAVCEAVTRTNICEASQIESELLLAEQENSKWDPIYTIWLTVPEMGALKLDNARSVAVAVLHSLGNNPNNPTPELPFCGLSFEHQQTIQNVATEVLSHNRGHELRHEIAVFVADINRLTIMGKLAPKPSQANFMAADATLNGTIRGFVNDHKKHAILMCSEEEGVVEINFLEEQLKNEVDLKLLVRLNLSKARCEVKSSKTISSSGKNIYAFISVEVARDKKSPRDFLSTQMVDIENSAIQTSNTSANESKSSPALREVRACS